MAQRFGGKYSPQGAATPDSAPMARVDRAPQGNWRATVLFVSAFAFLFPAFGDAPGAMVLGLAAGGLMIL